MATVNNDMTTNEFRKMALEIVGAEEKSHMNHPDFRLHNKIFASLGVPDESWGMVKLTPQQQSSFVKRAPRVFKACKGAWGRQGCTNVFLEVASPTVLRAALTDAAKNLE